MNLRRTRSASIGIPLSPIEPIFRISIQIRTSRRQLNRFYPSSRHGSPEHRAEPRVAIMQDVSPLLQESPFLPDRVARHLLHPSLVRMSCDPGQADATTLQVNEEQHVVRYQAAPAQHFDREEIHAGQDRHMRLNEFLPRRALASFWRRCNAMPLQDVPTVWSETA